MSVLSVIYNLVFERRIHDRPGPFDPLRVKKILVVRSDNIGDVICSTPAIMSLRKTFPKARLAALVCTLTQDVLREHPALDELYAYPKAKHHYKGYGKLRSWWELAKTLRRIRKEKFDLALSLRSDFSSSLAWLVYASGARWKVGPQAPARRKNMAFFFNTPLPQPENAGHEAQYGLSLLRELGLPAQEEKLCVALPAESQKKAKRFLQDHSLEQAPIVVNIGYWPYDPVRNWSPQNYRNLLEHLYKKNIPLAVSFGPGQEQWVEENILSPLALNIPSFCSSDLLDLAAMFSLAKTVITVDGGPTHLAAAVGSKMICLIEENMSVRWYPWKVKHKLVIFKENINSICLPQIIKALNELD